MGNGEGGDVQVRLSQEGGDEVLAMLQQIQAGIDKLAEAGEKGSEAVGKIGGDANITAMSTAASAIVNVGEKAWQAAEKVMDLVESVIATRSEMEQLEIRLTKINEQLMGFAAATEEAQVNLKGLVGSSTTASTGELVTLFQRLTFMAGGTDAQIRDLTQQMSLFAQSAGVTAEQLLRVITMAERTGQLSNRPGMQLATQQIQQILGPDAGAQIQAAAAAGTLGELLAKLQVSPEMAEVIENSWANLDAGIKREIEDLVADVGTGLDPLKGILQDLGASLKSPEMAESVRGITADLKALTSEIANLLKPVTGDVVQFFMKGLDSFLKGITIFVIDLKAQFDVAIATAAHVWDFLSKPTWNLDELRKSVDDYNAEVDRININARLKIQGLLTPAPKEGELAPNEGLWGGPAPVHEPGGSDMQRQMEAAASALDKLYEKADEQHQLAGLTGLDKQLTEIRVKADAEVKALIAAQDAMDKAQGTTPMSQGGVGSVATNRAISEIRDTENINLAAAQQKFDEEQQQARDKEAARELADYQKHAQEMQKAQEAYDATMMALEKKSADTTIGQIEAKYDAQEEQLRLHVQKTDDMLDKETNKAASEAAGLKAILDAATLGGILPLQPSLQPMKDQYDADLWLMADNTEKKRKLAEALGIDIVAIEKKKDLEIQTERDKEAGNWTAYYNDLMAKAHQAGDYSFATVQSTFKKVADEMYANAQTADQGFAAGLAKIQSSIKSFGQDISDFMTSVWSGLTNAFDTGFYDVLSGKFSDLSNVLHNLWDGILKDFSKMLTQMLERWIMTGDAMGNGQGGGGGFAGLFKALSEGGNQPVYTPEGTSGFTGEAGPTWSEGQLNQTTFQAPSQIDLTTGETPTSGGTNYGGYAMAAVAMVQAISANIGALKENTAEISYKNVGLGQANFGGNANFGADFTPFLMAAVAELSVPVLGWVGAVVTVVIGLIVAGLNSLINGPQEGHIQAYVSEAFQKQGVQTGMGNFMEQIIDSTTNFIGGLALRAAGPNAVQGYVTAYQEAFNQALGSAHFDFHAGSAADLTADVKQFFEQTFPTMALQAAFGQVGYGPPGSSNMPGGVAGMNWNTLNGDMDSQGKWIKQQLYDPNAPIPMMLAGLGFSADMISQIALKLAGNTDIKAFETYLSNLVGVVVDLGNLAKEFGRTTQEWFDYLHKAASDQGTVRQFTPDISNLQAEGQLLDTVFGDDRVAAAQQLVKDSQTLLSNMATALANILSLIDQINATTAATIKSYQDKLLTPAQREAEARSDYTTDVAAIAKAANPQAVADAWKKVMGDLSAILDAIVARIQAIEALQQSYADFRAQIAADQGPQFSTDPTGWLAKNASDIQKVTDALKTATGDQAVTDAQTLLQLTKDRYNNEIAMINQINQIIASVNTQADQSVRNLTLQGMGSVIGGKWTPDYHAQGEYLQADITKLEGQIASATTPDQIQAIWQKISQDLSDLAAEPQDPANYAASRATLIKMTQEAQGLVNQALTKMGAPLVTDVSHIGDRLTAGEDALATALEKAKKDFTTQLGLMTDASTAATTALTNMANDLTTAMIGLEAAINHWTWIMTHPAGEKDPGWNYGPETATVPPPGGGEPGGPTDGPQWTTDPDDPTYEINTRTGKRQKKTHATVPGGDQPGGPGALSSRATTGGNTNPYGDTTDSLGAFKKAIDDATKALGGTPPTSGGTPGGTYA